MMNILELHDEELFESDIEKDIKDIEADNMNEFPSIIRELFINASYSEIDDEMTNRLKY